MACFDNWGAGVYGTNFAPADGEDGFGAIPLSKTEGSATRKYSGPFAESADFVRTMLGGVQLISGVVSYVPEKTFPGFSFLVAKSASIETFGKPIVMSPSNEITYESCTVTITYGLVSYDLTGPNAYKEYSFSTREEAVTIDGYLGQFASGQRSPSPIPVPFRTHVVNIAWTQAPNDGTQWFDRKGKINSDSIFGQAPGFVKLADITSNQNQKGATGGDGWTRNYSFEIRDVHWNHMFNPFTGQWELYTMPGSNYTHRSASLAPTIES